MVPFFFGNNQFEIFFTNKIYFFDYITRENLFLFYFFVVFVVVSAEPFI